MTLSELKTFLGIAESDTSQDAILLLYLESAMQAAMEYANGYPWGNGEPLPGAIKLGILRYVQLAKQRAGRSGVVSESIAGMSKTYAASSDADYFLEAFDFWQPWHKKKGVTFRAARRAFNG